MSEPPSPGGFPRGPVPPWTVSRGIWGVQRGDEPFPQVCGKLQESQNPPVSCADSPLSQGGLWETTRAHTQVRPYESWFRRGVGTPPYECGRTVGRPALRPPLVLPHQTKKSCPFLPGRISWISCTIQSERNAESLPHDLRGRDSSIQSRRLVSADTVRRRRLVAMTPHHSARLAGLRACNLKNCRPKPETETRHP